MSRLAAITLAAVWGSREIRSMVYGFDTLADGDPSYKTSLIFLTNKKRQRETGGCAQECFCGASLHPFAIVFISGQYYNGVLGIFPRLNHRLAISRLQTNVVGYGLTCWQLSEEASSAHWRGLETWRGNISATYAAGPKSTFAGKIVFPGNVYVSDLSCDES